MTPFCSVCWCDSSKDWLPVNRVDWKINLFVYSLRITSLAICSFFFEKDMKAIQSAFYCCLYSADDGWSVVTISLKNQISSIVSNRTQSAQSQSWGGGDERHPIIVKVNHCVTSRVIASSWEWRSWHCCCSMLSNNWVCNSIILNIFWFVSLPLYVWH